jgi:hypothetical protein
MLPERHVALIGLRSRCRILEAQQQTNARHRLGRWRGRRQSHPTARILGPIAGHLTTADDDGNQRRGPLWDLKSVLLCLRCLAKQ